MRTPYITAHSGCEGTEQDSLASIERGLALGADIVEMDVRLDAVGTLRIAHNVELSQEAYETHVTLAEVFQLVGPTPLMINLDIKERQHIPAILALAAQKGFQKERVILSGAVSIEQLAQNPQWKDQAQIFLNLEELLKYMVFSQIQSPEDFALLQERPWKYIRPRLCSHADYVPMLLHIYRALDIAGLNGPQWFFEDAVCARLAGEDLPLSVWTVDDVEEQRRLLADARIRLVNLTTRNVASALRERAAHCGTQG